MRKIITALFICLLCSCAVWGQEGDVEQGNEYYNTGLEYYNTGDYESALSSFEKALEIYRNAFGEENARTADTYNWIGILLDDLGKYDKIAKVNK